MRKQIDPSASGRHTRCRAASGDSDVAIAWAVLRLKNNVPTSCTAQAHQSMRRGPGVARRRQARRRVAGAGPSKRTVSQYWSAAALVKNTDPTKKVTASATPPTPST